MAADSFKDVIRMIESEPRWKVVILTNLSRDITSILNMRITREKRLFMVASFHPSMIKSHEFLEKILEARRHGVEIPVVYVMWPPQIHKFSTEYFPMFQQHHILVHVRRYRGDFKKRHYPESYTWDEIKLMGRYMDDLTIKYMLCDKTSSGKESYAGMSYLGIGNTGDMWVCPDWAGDDLNMGNIIEGNAHPNTGPMILRGDFSDGTTDGIANLLETDMDELDDNHIMSFCRQVAFRLEGKHIQYPNYTTNFEKPSERLRLGLDKLLCQLQPK